MKIHRVASTLVGSVIVYVFVACSADTASQVSKQSDAGNDVAIGNVLDSVVDSLYDSLGVDGHSPVPDANAGPSDTSGSRIKVRNQVTTSPDGAKVTTFWEYFDTTLNIPCSPANAADDTLRCLPAGTTAANASGYYSDASCSNPFFYVATTSCTGTVSWGTVLEAGASCGSYHYRWYNVTQIATPTTYYTKSGTSCVKGTGAFPLPATSYTVYSGVEKPASAFSPMTQTYENQ